MTTIASTADAFLPIQGAEKRATAPSDSAATRGSVASKSAPPLKMDAYIGPSYTPEYLAAVAYGQTPEHLKRVADGIAYVNALRAKQEPHTYRTAGEAAEDGKLVTRLLSGAIESVNGWRSFLNPDFEAQIRAVNGDEAVEKLKRSLSQAVARSESFLSRLEGEIAGKFTVAGTLVHRHDDGSVSLGAYGLSFSGQGFGVRVGSDGSAYVARSGSGYERYEPGSGSNGLPAETARGPIDRTA